MQGTEASRQLNENLPDLILTQDGAEALQRTDMPGIPVAALPPIERSRARGERERGLEHVVVDFRHAVQLGRRVGKGLEIGVKKPIARGLGLEDTHGPAFATLMKSDKGPSEGVLPEEPFVSITW
jgi:hypothetical protein